MAAPRWAMSNSLQPGRLVAVSRAAREDLLPGCPLPSCGGCARQPRNFHVTGCDGPIEDAIPRSGRCRQTARLVMAPSAALSAATPQRRGAARRPGRGGSRGVGACPPIQRPSGRRWVGPRRAPCDEGSGVRPPETLQPLADLELGAQVAREVIAATDEPVGQVLLVDVVALEVVGVSVVAPAGAARPQVSRNRERAVVRAHRPWRRSSPDRRRCSWS